MMGYPKNVTADEVNPFPMNTAFNLRASLLLTNATEILCSVIPT